MVAWRGWEVLADVVKQQVAILRVVRHQVHQQVHLLLPLLLHQNLRLGLECFEKNALPNHTPLEEGKTKRVDGGKGNNGRQVQEGQELFHQVLVRPELLHPDSLTRGVGLQRCVTDKILSFNLNFHFFSRDLPSSTLSVPSSPGNFCECCTSPAQTMATTHVGAHPRPKMCCHYLDHILCGENVLLCIRAFLSSRTKQNFISIGKS